jgi:hypothetical protein
LSPPKSSLRLRSIMSSSRPCGNCEQAGDWKRHGKGIHSEKWCCTKSECRRALGIIPAKKGEDDSSPEAAAAVVAPVAAAAAAAAAAVGVAAAPAVDPNNGWFGGLFGAAAPVPAGQPPPQPAATSPKDRRWAELSDAERFAAASLGFDAAAWDERLPPLPQPDRCAWYLDWAELEAHERRAVSRLMGGLRDEDVQQQWDEQGWRRCYARDGAPSTAELLEVVEIIGSRAHAPHASISPWKARFTTEEAALEQFETDDEVSRHYLVRGWYGASTDEAWRVEMVGKPPDVQWVSEDTLLNVIKQQPLEESDSLGELLTDYFSSQVRGTFERARALGLGELGHCASSWADVERMITQIKGHLAEAAEGETDAGVRHQKLACAEFMIAIMRGSLQPAATALLAAARPAFEARAAAASPSAPVQAAGKRKARAVRRADV